ncbi:MAG TPA: class I SAM-dependent methyltransferase [Pseudonocardia sp.]|nr:class I SAM-dependent methyltransferase [Pseudonocardia sp.]
MDRVPDRVRWAVELLDPGAPERILEVGCGPGVAAALVCPRLSTGRMLATDRSALAVDRTSRRNTEHVAAGRLEVLRSALDALTAPPASFDQAFAINVNLFWVRDATAELQVLRRVLRPGGLLHVLYGAGGPTSAEQITTPIAAVLRAHGFTGVRTVGSDAGIGVVAAAPERAAAAAAGSTRRRPG